MRTRKGSLALGWAAVALSIVVASPTFADGGGRSGCALSRLDGLYVFAAIGVNTSGPFAGPTAIVELIRFDRDGTVIVPGVTVSLNGTVPPIPPGATGTYTISDVVPPDRACMGTLTFTALGITFDLYFPLKADTIWMIQTNAGAVLQGTATKLAR